MIAVKFQWPTLIAMTSPIRPLSPPNGIVYASASLAREEMTAERKFLQSFLVEAMELQARRKVALESQLHLQPKDSEDDDDGKVRAKHLRRKLAVPKNLAQVAAAERQIQSLSNDLMAGDDVGNIRSRVTPPRLERWSACLSLLLLTRGRVLAATDRLGARPWQTAEHLCAPGRIWATSWL